MRLKADPIPGFSGSAVREPGNGGAKDLRKNLCEEEFLLVQLIYGAYTQKDACIPLSARN